MIMLPIPVQTRRSRTTGFVHPLLLVLLTLILLLSASSGQCLNRQLDLNTATRKELCQLPFIGSDRAGAIVDYRKNNGPFLRINELLRIRGIGETSLQAIRPYLTINDNHTEESPPVGFSVRRRIDLAPGAMMVLPDDRYYEVLTDHIQGAEQSIDMAMYLFKITDSPGNHARRLMNELIKARKRGVMVRLILEQSDYNDSLNLENRRVARKLKKNRIKVQFDGMEKTSHTKLVVIDRRFTFLGSHNFSHSALSRNHEMSVLIDNQNLAEEMIDHIDMIGIDR